MTDGKTSHLARRWFWALIVVAVLAMGALYSAVKAQAGPAGLVVLISSVVLLGATAQATRIWLVLDKAPRVPPRKRSI